MTDTQPITPPIKKPEAKPTEAFADEIAALQALETHLGEKLAIYQGVKGDRAEGHPAHEAHNAVTDKALRAIGVACGACSQAREALSDFASHNARAQDLYDEAEAKRVFSEEFTAAATKAGKTTTRQDVETAWAARSAEIKSKSDAQARVDHQARIATAKSSATAQPKEPVK